MTLTVYQERISGPMLDRKVLHVFAGSTSISKYLALALGAERRIVDRKLKQKNECIHTSRENLP